jgi:hypothetical protein
MYEWREADYGKGDRVKWESWYRGKSCIREGVVAGYVPCDERASDIVPEVRNVKPITQVSTKDRYIVLVDTENEKPVKPKYRAVPSRTVDRCMRGKLLKGDRLSNRSRNGTIRRMVEEAVND